MKKALLLIFLISLMLVPSVKAQSTTPTMAGVQGGHLVFFYEASAPTIVDDQGVFYRDLKWSPDGEFLAYLRGDENYNWQLVVTDAAGTTPWVIVDNYFEGVPTFSWASFEGRSGYLLLYAEQGEPRTDEDAILNLWLRAPGQGGAAEIYTTVPYGMECGGGTSFPGDAIHWLELADFGYRSLLELVGSKILYSRNCTDRLPALYTPSTDTLTELGTLSNVALSPDRTRLAGTTFDEMHMPANKIVVVDLATLEQTEIETVAPADNLIWTGENTIFYSSYAATGEFQVPEDVAETAGYTVMSMYQSEVYYLNPATGVQHQVLSEPGYRIGRLAATGDPNTILASLIPNGDVWITNLQPGAEGNFTSIMGRPTGDQDVLSFFLPTVYTITATDEGGTASTSGEIIQIVTPHPSYNAQ